MTRRLKALPVQEGIVATAGWSHGQRGQGHLNHHMEGWRKPATVRRCKPARVVAIARNAPTSSHRFINDDIPP